MSPGPVDRSCGQGTCALNVVLASRIFLRRLISIKRDQVFCIDFYHTDGTLGVFSRNLMNASCFPASKEV